MNTDLVQCLEKFYRYSINLFLTKQASDIETPSEFLEATLDIVSHAIYLLTKPGKFWSPEEEIDVAENRAIGSPVDSPIHSPGFVEESSHPLTEYWWKYCQNFNVEITKEESLKVLTDTIVLLGWKANAMEFFEEDDCSLFTCDNRNNFYERIRKLLCYERVTVRWREYHYFFEKAKDVDVVEKQQVVCSTTKKRQSPDTTLECGESMSVSSVHLPAKKPKVTKHKPIVFLEFWVMKHVFGCVIPMENRLFIQMDEILSHAEEKFPNIDFKSLLSSSDFHKAFMGALFLFRMSTSPIEAADLYYRCFCVFSFLFQERKRPSHSLWREEMTYKECFFRTVNPSCSIDDVRVTIARMKYEFRLRWGSFQNSKIPAFQTLWNFLEEEGSLLLQKK